MKLALQLLVFQPPNTPTFMQVFQDSQACSISLYVAHIVGQTKMYPKIPTAIGNAENAIKFKRC